MTAEVRPAGVTRAGTTAADAVDQLERAFDGPYPGCRRLHARGTFCLGRFEPSGELAGLTRARALVEGETELLLRLSNGAAEPEPDDTSPGVRGMAVSFLSDGAPQHDLVASNFRVFSSSDPEGFLELTRVLGRLTTTRSSRRRALRMPGVALGFLRYRRHHPESKQAFRINGPPQVPASFATARYDGLHAYFLVAEDGRRTPFRFRLVPEAGEHRLSRHERQAQAADFLGAELSGRLTSGPVGFRLVLQLGQDGDSTDDPAAAWPEDRRLVDAGRILVESVAPDQVALQQRVFDPTRVPDGVALSDDPVLHFRRYVYGLSAERRNAGS